jgi:glycolate oxidase iron-sulfur subunit
VIPHENACILCGRCLEVCPLLAATQREELGPRAKHQLDAAVLAGTVSPRSATELAGLCLGCGRCAEVCPQGLDAAEVVAAMRGRHPGLREWLWKLWIRRASVAWPALAGLAARYPNSFPGQERIAPLRGMTPQSERRAWLQLRRAASAPDAAAPVAVFPGCLANSTRKDWLEKSDILLRAAEYRSLPAMAWECCGATLGHAGLRSEQHHARERNLAVWREAGRPPITTFCASCLGGLLAYATDNTLPWEVGEAALWAASIKPLSSLLLKRKCRAIETDQAPGEVHYHRPCHWRGPDTDLELLRQGFGEGLHAPKAGSCCGMGGIMQLGALRLSRTVAAACWENQGIAPGGALLTGCGGCVLQLSATAPAGVSVGHWLDVVSVLDSP